LAFNTFAGMTQDPLDINFNVTGNSVQTAYITHPDCLKHDMGMAHPECPQRLIAIENELRATGLLAQLQCYEAPLATTEQLARVHTARSISKASGRLLRLPD
jgi:acetoin utilization deacetylase AcuC-like enzyme